MALDEEQKPADSTEEGDQSQESETAPAVSSEPLAWMNDTLQWGVRVQPGRKGLTMRDLNVGIYGEVPESSSDMSRRPRGAFPVSGIPRTDLYALSARVDLWADNAVDLYEEAIQRRWMGHLEIGWDEITPQPYEFELAMRQFCTELAQQASIETDVIGQWLHKMNYAYHEVKTFLASEIFDTGRHYTTFRNRALHNEGSLGLESAGQFNRRMMETRPGWTEVGMFLYLVRGPLTLLLYRYGEAYARNRADKFLFRKCIEDKARHMAYGMAHVKYAVDNQPPGFGQGLGNLMRGVERDLVQDLRDPVLWEALAIIIGGSVANIAQGMAVVDDLKRQYIEDYLKRMQWAGVNKTEANLSPDLAAFLRREETAPTGD
ncbi:MAG: hypothetical protein OXE17_06110 [Chloroflexi bacterium]|nr:hypothetical protein [Chloroflexota bacterium]